MTNDKAVNDFIANKATIDALLARIADMSAAHFNVAPDDINYGHVGDLARTRVQLQEISDQLFREGGFAA